MSDAAYIVDALRTPFGRYGGNLSTVRPDDLAAVAIRALLERNPGLPPEAIDDVILGCANQAGEDNRNVARMAALLSGLPEAVPGLTVNRLCGSGLDAIGSAARAIRSGETQLMVAGGVESMTRAPFVIGKAGAAYSRSSEIHDTTIGWRFVNPLMQARYGIDSMPETAENVATEHGIARIDQDRFGLRSQQRALAAQASGFFERELVPVSVPQGKNEPKLVCQDEHPRETSLELLARLRPIVRPDGTVTAGNSSGINDGAGALLLASGGALARHGLKARARILGMATVGVAPRVMGIGPLPATLKLLAHLNLTLRDFDVIELNEAFAAQGLGVTRGLDLADDDPRVNPNGGAIAIGHPLGASGARLVATAVNQLEHAGGRRALCTMCIGVGQGIALALETT